MFIKMDNGERYNVLLRDERGVWVVSFDDPRTPFLIDMETFRSAIRIPSPEQYVENFMRERSKAEKARYELILPLLRDERCITDAKVRSKTFSSIAKNKQTTVKRVRALYCRYLATGTLVERRPRARAVNEEFDDAIRKYYFSAKKNTLRTAYELMILERYTNVGEDAEAKIPSWNSFSHYYECYWSKSIQKKIARDGLSNYQRNQRMLYGSAMAYRDKVGSYQIDETLGDVFLVSKFDRSRVIGRPYIYLAVDTCTQLITGVYVGLDSGENAVLACIANAVADKVAFCASLGIEIQEEDWPSKGMPMELITDKGGEFTGQRISELCIQYGVEINTLPPFRAEEKPLVERAMGLIQSSYQSMLQGKGSIGEDANERWATDYRMQAVLSLEEYTQIVVRCIVVLNKSRVLKELGHLPVGVPKTPAKLWMWFCEQKKSAVLDIDEREVYLRSLPRSTAKISRRGISFEGLRYVPARGMDCYIGQRVEFAYDKQKRDYIYILDEKRNMIPCCLAQSETQLLGFGSEDIAAINEADREVRKQLEQIELESRIRMRKDILNVIARAEEQKSENKNVVDISKNRAWEKEKLT